MNPSPGHENPQGTAAAGGADCPPLLPKAGSDDVGVGVSPALRGNSASGLDFVNVIASLAERAKQAGPAEGARRRLAVEMVYRFVPGTTILGIRVRRWIAGPKPVDDRIDYSSDLWAPEGFKPSLTRGGQDGEVVRHVAAAAACVLVGRVYLVRLASLYDWVQGLFRGRAEAKAEVAGNEAGIRVGRILLEYLDGRLDVARLKAMLAALLT